MLNYAYNNVKPNTKIFHLLYSIDYITCYCSSIPVSYESKQTKLFLIAEHLRCRCTISLSNIDSNEILNCCLKHILRLHSFLIH